MFELTYWWALLFAPLPWLLVWRVKTLQTPQQALKLRAPALAFAPMLQSAQVQKPRHLSWVFALYWLALVAAASHPKWIGEPIPITKESREVMLAVDLSGSMVEEDMQYGGRYLDRLSVVKAVLSEFIEKRQGDKLGLILFADTAFLQAPLTHDLSTVATLLEEAEIGLVGRATAIGDALGLAVKRFSDKASDEPQEKVVILLTDGQNTAGNLSPEQALLLAKEHQVKVYTVAVGAETIRSGGFFGLGAMSRNNNAIDESLLQTLANETGGKYYRATDVASLQTIYSTLDALEPINQDAELFRPEKALFYYPLGLALGLLILIWCVKSARLWFTTKEAA